MTSGIGRRRVIAGSAGLGLATPLLAACGGGETATDEPGGSGSGGGSAGSSGGGGGEALGATSDVPVGGGAIFEDQEVVVTQPAEGDFKCFTSICTHQGCPVDSVENNEISCPCHGSVFSAEDGSVVNGPATEPLAAVEIMVEGDEITLA